MALSLRRTTPVNPAPISPICTTEIRSDSIEHEFTTGERAGTTGDASVGPGRPFWPTEDRMVFDHRAAILEGLKRTPKVKQNELITNGFDAAAQDDRK